jgi:outer membrane protein
MEQSVLLAAATVYMDISRDSANLEVQQNNVRVLERTLTDTRNRFSAGQVTDTDVAQSEAQLAAAQATLHAAESTLSTTRANYRRVIGVGAAQNPSVTAALYGVDVAQLQVKIAEGALFPTLAAQYNVQYGVFRQLLTPHQFTDTVMPNLSVPIYQGGAEYSTIRLNKETVSQQRLNVDDLRDQMRANVVQGCKRRRHKSKPRNAKTMPRSAHSPVCATKRWRASGRRKTCSTPSRFWSMLARTSSSPSTIRWWRPTACCRRWADYRLRCWGCRCRSTIRWCIISRSATPGSDCARRAEIDRVIARHSAT